jgi:hypothetical protein
LCLTSLTLSGNFEIETVEPLEYWPQEFWPVGDDLASTVGHANGWTCRLDGVSYDAARVGAVGTTRVYADSFRFQFTGVDAAMLDEIAGQ